MTNHSWTIETIDIINRLTPDIKGKAFDPDWFLLRQRLEQIEEQLFESKRLLLWSLWRMEFPLVPNPEFSHYHDSEYQVKGCPGCRVPFSREMLHKDNCDYIKAQNMIAPPIGEKQ